MSDDRPSHDVGDEPCQKCRGIGGWYEAAWDWQECPNCEGTGEKPE
ncbi:MAG: hypothetical protein H0W82_02270 [Actinobacteria bacterium]|nr:hypothetical protein [Actinomycetota bacterium]